ncbi:putative membrane protein (TIGR02234 family) [Friedmanniella endophytica]|uniref:Putative membrane protein (TIGR02234 family) n=1 Tax=Microlunatus kandeliicorticis TaxID=1759536 RepID=A0A7W3ITZ3_9ACTN|nr:Trp biosynthesis-associated membrane protein [Microlunatus kandeliicorticis]MBA8795199.1 putative membrane protein (TIGR02234 family) [Microlunatus kandeliicorticis]
MSAPTETRSRSLALGGLALAGLAGLVTGSQAWWRARGAGDRSSGGLGTAIDVAFTGTDATGGLTAALSVVVLAGTLLALVLRATGRRVLAVLVAVVAGAMAVVGFLRLRPSAAVVADRVQQTTLLDAYRLEPTWWNLGYAAAGLVGLAAAVLMLLRAGRWPRRPDRFRRDAGSPAVAAASVPADPDTDPARWWRAQDAGIDPTTLEPGADPARLEPAGDPAEDVAVDPTEEAGTGASGFGGGPNPLVGRRTAAKRTADGDLPRRDAPDT